MSVQDSSDSGRSIRLALSEDIKAHTPGPAPGHRLDIRIVLVWMSSISKPVSIASQCNNRNAAGRCGPNGVIAGELYSSVVQQRATQVDFAR